jgi:hypothetical protein
MVTRNWKHVSIAAMAAGALAAGVVTAGGGAEAAGPNRRPICNSLPWFTLPSTVGGQVEIPVLDHAADPDVEAVRLVSVFSSGVGPLGTAQITDNGTRLVFTRTNAGPGTAEVYWTVSDGSLTAQCQAHTSNMPDPDNG